MRYRVTVEVLNARLAPARDASGDRRFQLNPYTLSFCLNDTTAEMVERRAMRLFPDWVVMVVEPEDGSMPEWERDLIRLALESVKPRG